MRTRSASRSTRPIHGWARSTCSCWSCRWCNRRLTRTQRRLNRKERGERKETNFTLRSLRSLRLCCVCVLVGAPACSRAVPQADLRPIPRQNVLLITLDTRRGDALGSDGGAAATPALDALAASGVRFDFAHAHAVLTLTSHASILTGTYPFQHGLRENGGYRMPQNARTAATLL